MRLQRLLDAMTVAVGVAVLAVLAANHLSRDTPGQAPAGQVDSTPLYEVRIDPAVGIDFAAGERTLIMVLRSDCRYCRESMPFYRRLLARDTDATQVVVVAPPDDREMGDYLAFEQVRPDALTFAEPNLVPVSSTPTLLMTDAEGLVTHAWVGLLDADREADVFVTLFDRAST